jgi:hypothetical protein
MTPLLKKVAKARAKATTTAKATANAGILHCVQNDGCCCGDAAMVGALV